MSNVIKLEYIWLDGNTPQQLRSKVKITKKENNESIKTMVDQYREGKIKASVWNFDGSSTFQAETDNSELLLNPVNFFIDPFYDNSILVLCEVLNVDMTPHKSNTRGKMIKSIEKLDDDTLYGYEQEFFICDNNTKKPLGWPSAQGSFPPPQGNYYCAIGSNNVSGRDFMDEYTNLCIKSNLSISGTNAEVALGQWEYQIGPVPAKDGSDQLWISRYILSKLGEKYNYYIDLDPKPFVGDNWNGSGMHVNFSTKTLREDKKNKKEIAIEMCKKLSEKHDDHIKVYGINNEKRLTGKNETSSMTKFGWGIGDRTKSIRIPSVINDAHAIGYIEDRRPASSADPYLIVDKLLTTICSNSKVEA